MLISALCDYYDVLAKAGKILPDGFSYEKISYLIALTPDGSIDDIINIKNTETIYDKKGKAKNIEKPIDLMFPKRPDTSSIVSHVIEHRPEYIFGLDYDKSKGFIPNTKKHKAFIDKNIDFIEGIDNPIVNAYRNFILNWKPEDELRNEKLNIWAKDTNCKFAFCLSGKVNDLLQDNEGIKNKWLNFYQQDDENKKIAQCAILGVEQPIARTHKKIDGVVGGLTTGTGLVNFKGESGKSYCNEDSYNSNISELAMNKYTEALNYLLKDRKHKKVMDDVTILYWATDNSEEKEDLFASLLYGDESGMDSSQTAAMLDSLMVDAKAGAVSLEKLKSCGVINPDVDFYMVGIKPNASRLAIKFICKKRYAEILYNIAKFQENLKINDSDRKIYFNSIKKELVSPKSSKENVNSALLAKIFEAVINNYPLPICLLENIIRRVKTDSDDETNKFIKVNNVRVGLIKAYINRKNNKEEIKVGLDLENNDYAYLCGRLFATLEKIQQNASGNLNRTIKDAYFSSAVSRPVLVFPKLIKLSQNHLDKLSDGSKVYFSRLIGEIVDKLNGGFPKNLNMEEQGKFIVGYYQQYQDFFNKDENNKTKKEVEE